MLKYLFVSIVIAVMYRFWDSKPKIDKTGQEEDQYTEYEDIDE